MSNESDLLNYGPLTLAAGAGFMLTVTYFIRTIASTINDFKNKRVNSEQSNVSTIYTAEFRRLNNTIESSEKALERVSKGIEENIKILERIVNQVSSLEKGENDIKRELDRIHDMANNLVNTHADPNSVFSTVKVLEKLERLIVVVQGVEVKLAGLKI